MRYFSSKRIMMKPAVHGDNLETRMIEYTAEYMAIKTQFLNDNHRCLRCFMTKGLCVCSSIQNIFTSNSTLNGMIQSKVHIFMHHREWGRASNTGKLLFIGMNSSNQISSNGNNCTMNIYGIPEQQSELIGTLSNNPSVILYPSKGSHPISNYIDLFKQSNGNFHICLIDSTWPQSKSMEQTLPPSIPRVHIDEEVDKPSQFLNRKQSANLKKVSTIEALAYALIRLGETPAVVEPLHEALRLSVDAVLKQSGKESAYGNIMIPIVSKEDRNLPYTAPSVNKPTHCPKCNASGISARFKNKGIHTQENADRIINNSESSVDKCASHLSENHLSGIKIHQQESTDFSTFSTTTELNQKALVYRVWFCKSCHQYFSLFE